MNKLLHTLVAGLLLASASFSSVAEPVALNEKPLVLNETEMDNVTAGAGFAASFAKAAGTGLFLGVGKTKTFSNVTVIPVGLVHTTLTTTLSKSSAVGL